MLLTLGLTAMGQAEDGGELRVSLCIAETRGDLGFYDSANEGLKRLEADYGVIGSVVECKSDASICLLYTSRYVLQFFWKFFSNLSTPWLNGILGLVFLCGAAFLVCDAFDCQRVWRAGAVKLVTVCLLYTSRCV